MSFIDKLATVNECGTIFGGETGCTYDTFMTEMLNIENMINEAVNTFNRLVNTEAISTLLEDGGELTTELHKNNLLTKLKAAWAKIVELFFQMLDNIYNWIYEQVVLQTKFIDKHKDDIMKTTIVYGKQKGTILDTDGKKVKNYTVLVSQPYINSYSKILNPDFIEPLMNESDLKKYMNENGKVDTKKIYAYYLSEILGHRTDIDIDDINKNKDKLIDGVKSRFKDVKDRKAKIISIRKKYQAPPKDISPETVKEFQTLSMAQVESLKAYNKASLEYCKGAASILKTFIKNSKKEEK